MPERAAPATGEAGRAVGAPAAFAAPDIEIETETEAEIVDGLPVLAEVRAVERFPLASLPAVQAVAAAATGFVAGAATLALVRRHGSRRLARRRRLPGGAPILETRSFLVDVHLIGRPGE